MKHIIKNIFLDTNIYEENNFFHSTQIHNLFHYSQIGVINLYMTRISYWETIDRMKKGLTKIKEEHDKYVNSIYRTRILKNLKNFENVEKTKFTIHESVKELTIKLDTIIKVSNIKFIEPQEIDINSIFYLYYNSLPPFNRKTEKKHEFPDAFIIKTIENWCEKNSKRLIFLTKDNDFKDYKSKRIIFKNDLTKYLEDVSMYYDSLQATQLIPEIEKRIRTYNEELLVLIDDELNNVVALDLDFEKISNFHRTFPEYVEFKITSLNPDFADITYLIMVKYSFYVIPTALDIYKANFSDDLKPKLYNEKLIIPCDLEVHFKKENDIRLKWINSNEIIKLKLK